MNILITGGGSGLGASIVRRLAQHTNDFVYFTYAKSAESALQLEQDLSNTKAIKCDFTDEKEIDSLLNQIAACDIDILINNAYHGAYLNTYFHKTPSEDFTLDFNYNILPVIKITQASILHFRKKKSGKIITILSSLLTNVTPVGAGVYAANKAYLKQLTKVWAAENIKFNISSNAISPDFMSTSLTAGTDERIVEQMIAAHPLKRLLSTDEVADAVDFITHTTTQINGIDLLINSGITMR
jgi:NAD(P)-dependent dehydrogenase (short-subunit alcohol dehydrogenase family)